MRFLANVLCGLIVYCRKPKKPSSGIGTLPFLPAIPKTPPVLIFSQKWLSFSCLVFGDQFRCRAVFVYGAVRKQGVIGCFGAGFINEVIEFKSFALFWLNPYGF